MPVPMGRSYDRLEDILDEYRLIKRIFINEIIIFFCIFLYFFIFVLLYVCIFFFSSSLSCFCFLFVSSFFSYCSFIIFFLWLIVPKTTLKHLFFYPNLLLDMQKRHKTAFVLFKEFMPILLRLEANF